MGAKSPNGAFEEEAPQQAVGSQREAEELSFLLLPSRNKRRQWSRRRGDVGESRARPSNPKGLIGDPRVLLPLPLLHPLFFLLFPSLCSLLPPHLQLILYASLCSPPPPPSSGLPSLCSPLLSSPLDLFFYSYSTSPLLSCLSSCLFSHSFNFFILLLRPLPFSQSHLPSPVTSSFLSPLLSFPSLICRPFTPLSLLCHSVQTFLCVWARQEKNRRHYVKTSPQPNRFLL